MKKYLILGISGILVMAVFMILLFAGNKPPEKNNKTPAATPVPTSSVLPERIPEGYKLYSNREFGFSLVYPENWSYMVATHYNINNLFAVVFNRIDNPEETYGIRILDKKDAVSLRDWANKYWMSLPGKKKMSQSTVGANPAIILEETVAGGDIWINTLVRKGNHIFLFNHQKGISEEVFQKALDSFRFD